MNRTKIPIGLLSQVLAQDNVIVFQNLLEEEHHDPSNEFLHIHYITNCLKCNAFACLQSIWHPKFVHPQYGLFGACYSARAVHELIRLGASPNTEYDGYWPLTQMCNLECVDALMTYPNVDINARDQYGKTILHYFIEFEWLYEAVCELVERWMPKLVSKCHWKDTLWEQYFEQILPQRHTCCTQSALFIVHCRLLPVRDLCLMISRHVWKSRRDPVWDLS